MIRKQLVIFPCNGNGMEALDCINPEQYECIGFIDDDLAKEHPDLPVYARSILLRHPDLYLLAVPGGPSSFKNRATLIQSLNHHRFATIIHPGASVGRKVRIGANCLFMAGVVLTSNAVVGDHVCILPNSVVHHDSFIGAYTLVGSNVAIAGGVTIGKNCYIGSGTNIKNGISVGACAQIGLGSNVIKDVAANTTVAGNPAKSLYPLQVPSKQQLP